MLLPLVFVCIYCALSVRVLVDLHVQAGVARVWIHGTLSIAGMRRHFSREAALWQRQGYAARLWRIGRAYGELLLAAAKTIRWGQIDVLLRIGAGDAGATAITAGAACAGLRALLSGWKAAGRCAVRVEPDFSHACFFAGVHCIFSVTPGDIILAVVAAAARKVRREGLNWLSIPLRA